MDKLQILICMLHNHQKEELFLTLKRMIMISCLHILSSESLLLEGMTTETRIKTTPLMTNPKPLESKQQNSKKQQCQLTHKLKFINWFNFPLSINYVSN